MKSVGTWISRAFFDPSQHALVILRGMPMSHVSIRSFIALALMLTACADASDPASSPGDGRLAIAVAPLELPGVADASYEITVRNDDGDVVWTRAGLTSDAYGDGAGSLSYVGACDADPSVQPNHVTLVIEGIEDAGGAPLDFVDPTPLTRDAECLQNADVAVTFDITVARPASQGFFDVAVSFEDIFCSAKLDCLDEGQPLELLHDADGGRGTTAVVAFACTSGDASDTHLHLDPLAIDCSDDTHYVVDPSGGPGNLGGQPPLLFQTAVYRGTEQLPGVTKRYWNIALGLDYTAGAPSCALTTRATATSTVLGPGGVTPAGSVWPVLTWAVDLTQSDGTRACSNHALDDEASGVAVTYTDGAGEAFDYSWAGDLVVANDELDCGVTPGGDAVTMSPVGGGVVVTVAGDASDVYPLPTGATLLECCGLSGDVLLAGGSTGSFTCSAGGGVSCPTEGSGELTVDDVEACGVPIALFATGETNFCHVGTGAAGGFEQVPDLDLSFSLTEDYVLLTQLDATVVEENASGGWLAARITLDGVEPTRWGHVQPMGMAGEDTSFTTFRLDEVGPGAHTVVAEVGQGGLTMCNLAAYGLWTRRLGALLIPKDWGVVTRTVEATTIACTSSASFVDIPELQTSLVLTEESVVLTQLGVTTVGPDGSTITVRLSFDGVPTTGVGTRKVGGTDEDEQMNPFDLRVLPAGTYDIRGEWGDAGNGTVCNRAELSEAFHRRHLSVIAIPTATGALQMMVNGDTDVTQADTGVIGAATTYADLPGMAYTMTPPATSRWLAYTRGQYAFQKVQADFTFFGIRLKIDGVPDSRATHAQPSGTLEIETLDLHDLRALTPGVSHDFRLEGATGESFLMRSNGFTSPYTFAQKLGTLALPIVDLTSP